MISSLLAQVAPVVSGGPSAAPPDWIQTFEAVWTLLSVFVIPLLVRHSLTARKIATVVIQGVEAAGDEKTKAAVRDLAERSGIQPKLAPFVEKVTEAPPQKEGPHGS